MAKDDVIADSLGADIEGLVVQQSVKEMFTFAANAYSAYSTGLSASTSAQYAWNQLANPATFYAAAVTVVVTYLLTPQCSQHDMETSAMKNSGLCHYIGKYCSSRISILGGSICIQRKNSYCCFNSELARIINEQGRLQMGPLGGWGTPKNPNCQGFTPEQFQSLDFGAMDLSGYHGFIQQNADQLINNNTPQQNTKDAVQNFYNAL